MESKAQTNPVGQSKIRLAVALLPLQGTLLIVGLCLRFCAAHAAPGWPLLGIIMLSLAFNVGMLLADFLSRLTWRILRDLPGGTPGKPVGRP